MKSESLEGIEKFYNDILRDLDIAPISQSYRSLLDARIVHDLGISGDDFSDFYEEIQARRYTNILIPKKFIPAELSKESHAVAILKSWPAKKFPFIQRYYRSKIKCPPLKIIELHGMLFQNC